MKFDLNWNKVADKKPDYNRICLVYSEGPYDSFQIAYLESGESGDDWMCYHVFEEIDEEPTYWIYADDLIETLPSTP